MSKFRVNTSREFFKIDLLKIKDLFDYFEGEYCAIDEDDEVDDEVDEADDKVDEADEADEKKDDVDSVDDEEENNKNSYIKNNKIKREYSKIHDCKVCHYITKKKSSFINHLQSRKHILRSKF